MNGSVNRLNSSKNLSAKPAEAEGARLRPQHPPSGTDADQRRVLRESEVANTQSSGCQGLGAGQRGVSVHRAQVPVVQEGKKES